jgi:hypothetical protein
LENREGEKGKKDSHKPVIARLRSGKDQKEVQISHEDCKVQAIPNVIRSEIWDSQSLTEV